MTRALADLAPPAPGTSVALAPTIEWLRLPLPGSLGHINVWLLDDGDGWTLIDTGMNLPDVRAAWDGPLAVHFARQPLKRIVCTHHHPDHAGLAAWLAERHRAAVYMSAPEHDLLARAYAERNDPGVAAARFAAFERDGLEVTPARRPVLAGAGFLSVMSGLPAGVTMLRAGETFTAGGIEWRLLELRGHTDGQLLLHSPAAGLLIAGDQVLPRISSNIGIYPERRDGNPLQSYLDSFAVLEALEPEPWVLPSHGDPFQGLRARIAELRHHHRRQLAALCRLCESPLSAAEAAAGLYRGATDPLHRMLAVGETLAHLALLEAGGRVRAVEGPGGPRRFMAVPGPDPGG
jgi:glyoxylase-like metal-dependent hydrolase (beta-lactamase superfamily II)